MKKQKTKFRYPRLRSGNHIVLALLIVISGVSQSVVSMDLPSDVDVKAIKALERLSSVKGLSKAVIDHAKERVADLKEVIKQREGSGAQSKKQEPQ